MNYWDQIKCSIKHNWVYKKESISYKSASMFGNAEFDYTTEIECRICSRCFQKQKRYNWTGVDKVDWSECSLNKEEFRDKRLKYLGI